MIAIDWSGSTGSINYTPMTYDSAGIQTGGGVMGNTSAATAQMRWLDVFMNNSNVKDALAAGTMQIGITGWGSASQHLNQGPLSMSTNATGAGLIALYSANWNATNQTNAQAAIDAANPFGNTGGLGQLNDKINSSLSADYPGRTQNNNFKQILIVVTDGTAGTSATGIPSMQSPNVISTVPQDPNTGTWAGGANQSLQMDLQDPTKQEIYAVFCGNSTDYPALQVLLNSISNSTYNNTNPGVSGTPGPNQYAMDTDNNSQLEAMGDAIAADVCSIPFACDCPPGYTTVYLDPALNTYTASTGICDDVTPPICRRVECECPPATIPGTVTTELGTCPDSAPLIYQVGDPNFVSDRQCNYFFYISTTANYDVGGFGDIM